MRRLFEPVDAASLVAFRIAFGILMFVEVGRYFIYGCIDRYFIPTFHFTYFGFGWVRPWAGPGLHVHFAALGNVLGSLFVYEPIVTLFAFGALLFDLFAVPLLIWHRTRPVAFSLAVMFHAMNWRLFDIGIFPLMIAATCVFFDPGWPWRIWQRVRPFTPPPAKQPTARMHWWSPSRLDDGGSCPLFDLADRCAAQAFPLSG